MTSSASYVEVCTSLIAYRGKTTPRRNYLCQFPAVGIVNGQCEFRAPIAHPSNAQSLELLVETQRIVFDSVAIGPVVHQRAHVHQGCTCLPTNDRSAFSESFDEPVRFAYPSSPRCCTS